MGRFTYSDIARDTELDIVLGVDPADGHFEVTLDDEGEYSAIIRTSTSPMSTSSSSSSDTMRGCARPYCCWR
jgi:hypothetical protein